MNKKYSSDFVDTTMGSYDSESSKIVNSFLLHQITTKHGNNFVRYKND